MKTPLSMGIDISKWQGDFDLKRAKNEGVKFVVVKCGGGDGGLYIDRQFEENYKKAKALSLPVGAYWFSKALTVTDAKKEAEYFYKNGLAGKQFELPVYMDVEHAMQLSLGQRKLTDIVKTFCSTLESKGYYVGIYSTAFVFANNMYDEELARYTHWIACWAKTCNYKNTSLLGMWQYGGEVNKIRSDKIAGITCDQNYLYVDFPTVIKQQKLNGFGGVVIKPAASTAPKKTVEELADEVIRGLWSTGAQRKKLLTDCGYDYTAVQAEVNARLKKRNET